MPAMMVPAIHEHNYSATIRVVVEDSLGAATFVDISFQVRWPLVMTHEFHIMESSSLFTAVVIVTLMQWC